ncbi:DNase I-like protein, partial [Trametes sanguinea]
MYVNQVMRDRKLAVLALQETHLSDERAADLSLFFASTHTIHHSADPDNPHGSRGVAFVLDKRRLAGRTPTVHVIVPSRALYLEYPWTPTKSLCLLNVYAPNAAAENAAFWETVTENLRRSRLRRPDVLLGDFNVTLSALDRFPARSDAPCAVDALADALHGLDLIDSWRVAFPHDRLYTYRQYHSDTQSRLDRIYVRRHLQPLIADWAIEGPGPLSDHQLILCSMANYQAPQVGKGRWMAPVTLLQDAVFVRTMKTLGFALQRDLLALAGRSAERNPQLLLQAFKEDLVRQARQRLKEWVPKVDKQIAALRERLHALQN